MAKLKVVNINEIAQDQARKDAGISQDPIYIVAPIRYPEVKDAAKAVIRASEGMRFAKHVAQDPIHTKEQEIVQAHRWSDARAFGVRFFGCGEVIIRPFDKGKDGKPFPRWQLSTEGNASNNSLCQVHRRIYDDRDVKDDGTRVPWVKLLAV